MISFNKWNLKELNYRHIFAERRNNIKSCDPWSGGHRSSCFSETVWWQTLFPDIQINAVWPIKPTESKLPQGKNTLWWTWAPSPPPEHRALQSCRQDSSSQARSWMSLPLQNRSTEASSGWCWVVILTSRCQTCWVRVSWFPGILHFYRLLCWKTMADKKREIQTCLLCSGTKAEKAVIMLLPLKIWYRVCTVDLSTCIPSAKSCVFWASVNGCRRTEEKITAEASRWCWDASLCLFQ